MDLPEARSDVVQFEKFGEIKSVKTVSDLISPLAAKIPERNQAVLDDPELVNRSPYADGWPRKVEIADQARLDDLLGAAEYEAFAAADNYSTIPLVSCHTPSIATGMSPAAGLSGPSLTPAPNAAWPAQPC